MIMEADILICSKLQLSGVIPATDILQSIGYQVKGGLDKPVWQQIAKIFSTSTVCFEKVKVNSDVCIASMPILADIIITECHLSFKIIILLKCTWKVFLFFLLSKCDVT